jgi:uncharacterized membrane protein
MIQDSVFVLMRWLHVGSAALIIGGLALIVLSAEPIRALTRNDQLTAVIRKVERRYRWVLGASLLGLVASGIYQWVIFGQSYQEQGMWVLAVLSVKVLLATGFFALLWAFQIDSMVDERARAWRWVSFLLALLVLMLGGVVRYLRLEHMGLL